jgi:hypothetical protein
VKSLAIAILAGLATACGPSTSPVSDALAIDTLPGGIVRTISSAPSEPGAWALIEERELDLGGRIGYLRDLTLLDDGSVVVADLDPAALHLFAPTGEWVRSIGRDGAGPGEFEDAFLASRGDTIYVQDRRSARLSAFRSTGDYLGQVGSVCCLTEGMEVTGDGRLVVPMPAENASSRRWWRAAGLDGRQDTVAITDSRISRPPTWTVRVPGGDGFGKLVPLVPTIRTATGPGGRVLVGWSGDYLLRWTSTGLDTIALFGRAGSSGRPLGDDERADLAASFARTDASKEGLPFELLREAYDPDLLPATPELFDAFWVDPSGKTWVQRSSFGGDSTEVRLDLFDRGGVLLDEILVPADRWPTNPYHRAVSWNQQGVAVGFESEEGFTVLRYRVVHSSRVPASP